VTWYRARVGEVCGSCNQRQLALAPMRRLATGRGRCAACAKRLFNEDVPAALAQAEAQLGTPPAKPAKHVNGARPLQPFVKRMRRWLEAHAPDVKARAAGEKP
jgi:hypothetical protein